MEFIRVGGKAWELPQGGISSLTCTLPFSLCVPCSKLVRLFQGNLVQESYAVSLFCLFQVKKNYLSEHLSLSQGA